MLKIAFDAKRLYRNFTGLGNYSRTLINNYHLQFPDDELHLYSPKITRNSETEHFINHKTIRTHIPKGLNKIMWRTHQIVKELVKTEIDIYHGLSHEIPVGLPKHIKSVVSMHDLIVMHYPNQFKAIDRLIYKQKYRYACHNADHIIAISESTKNDLIKYYNISPEKVSVVYQTCGEQFRIPHHDDDDTKILKKYQIPDEYLLYVGSVIERKGLQDIVEALNKLQGKLTIPLVIIGNGNEYQQRVKDYINEHDLHSKIIWLKRIPNYHLPAVYRNAAIFVYPSIYEGFGIPVIEAQYSKTPVITTNRSSLPEAAGEFAEYVAPNNSDEIARAILKLLQNKQYTKKLIEGAHHHVQKFSPEKLSLQLHEIYHKIRQKY